MASALKDQGRPDTEGTIKFVDMIDRVFDCLNVTRKGQDKKGKKELREYSSIDDWRFKVCFFIYAFNWVTLPFFSNRIFLNNVFGPPTLGKRVPMISPTAFSLLVGQFSSKIVHRIFLKICMKL